MTGKKNLKPRKKTYGKKILMEHLLEGTIPFSLMSETEKWKANQSAAKWLVSFQSGETAGLKYIFEEGVVAFGGYKKDRELIERFIDHIFKSNPVIKETQRNKIQMRFSCPWLAFKGFLSDIEKEDNVQVKRVKALGRLMS